MIKIKFDNELYDLPQNWNEVKIHHFQKIKKLNYEELGQLKYVVRLLQIFTGLPENVILNAKTTSLQKIYDVINFIYTEKLSSDITHQFKIGDDIYTLKEFNDMTTGERISLEVLLENPIDDIIPEMMAILFRKNDEVFDASKMHDIADDIAAEVSIGQLYGVMLFFYQIEKKFLKDIQDYLEEQKEMEKMMKMNKMMRMIYKIKKKLKLMLGSIGTTLRTHWQKGSIWTYRKFMKRTLSQH